MPLGSYVLPTPLGHNYNLSIINGKVIFKETTS